MRRFIYKTQFFSILLYCRQRVTLGVAVPLPIPSVITFIKRFFSTREAAICSNPVGYLSLLDKPNSKLKIGNEYRSARRKRLLC